MIRILLAEDDTSMREYLARALTRVGYDVSAVGCGTEAIPLLETDKFDLLLTDIVMPEMEGPELASRLLAMRPQTPVLFMSGYADAAERLGLAGDRRFIQKPFTPDALARKVREALAAPDPN